MGTPFFFCGEEMMSLSDKYYLVLLLTQVLVGNNEFV